MAKYVRSNPLTRTNPISAQQAERLRTATHYQSEPGYWSREVGPQPEARDIINDYHALYNNDRFVIAGIMYEQRKDFPNIVIFDADDIVTLHSGQPLGRSHVGLIYFDAKIDPVLFTDRRGHLIKVDEEGLVTAHKPVELGKPAPDEIVHRSRRSRPISFAY